MRRFRHLRRSNELMASVAAVVFAWLLPYPSLSAQELQNSQLNETKSEVPELIAFHEVVYKIWHTAWPEKDVVLLKDLVPEVQKLGTNLCQARLPGILREKQAPWTENTNKLKSIVAEYSLAAEKDDKEKLLDAAERLHAQYETMVRLIRPALKELDEFHAVLYSLYHYFKPQNNRDKTVEAVALLNERMEALNKAKLPARLKGKEGAFAEGRTKMAESLISLNSSLKSADWTTICRDIDTLHARYEDLNRVFE